MSVINTNTASTIAANSLMRNERAMGTSMERLSTGLRINSSKDDAAGLAISTRMNSQVRGLDQAVRNANDAVSLIQTAEGALTEVTNMMQRMRELAVQSSNDTNNTDDRSYMDAEFQALATEITRVRNTTEFNNTAVLDGSTPRFTFQIGAEATQTIEVAIPDIAGASGTNGTALTATEIAITAPDGTNGQVAAIDFIAADTLASFSTGDNISMTVGDQTFSYTVTAADVADLTATNNSDGVGDLLATKFAALINSNSTLQGSINASASVDGTNMLTLTSVDVDNPFSVSVMAGATDATSVSGNVLTQSAASTAITTLDTALDNISEIRADLGAYMNRLTHTVDNLSNISQNTQASLSRIQDADYAKETTELARTQIISQAGTAMLAQANQVKQTVLSLLK
jgi:flagellin